MPSSLQASSGGVGIGSDGAIRPGAVFRRLEFGVDAWDGAIIHGGAPVILDEVFVTGIEGRPALGEGTSPHAAIGRGTNVFALIDGRWKIVHEHLSCAANG